MARTRETLTLQELRKMADDAYNNCRVVRMDAADDLVFAWVTQWDDNLLSTSDLAYRGEFNIINKAIRQVMAEMRANPVDISYEPLDNSTNDQAELLEGFYRTEAEKNSSLEAFFNADQECVSCGVGAWELYTDYETVRGKKQVIKRRPIHEANNVVLWDPQSKLMDKSDANYCVILDRYTKEGYCELVEEMTGEEYEPKDLRPGNFKFPQYSYTFPWMAGNFDWIFIATIYHREMIDDVIVTLIDPITQETSEYYDSDLKEKMDELLAEGKTIIKKTVCERSVVRKYIASAEMILNGEEGEEIACEHIPVVPQYGERVFVEGQEVWRGLVKLAKDPQRLRNFLMSYVADIASRSPRPKPMFHPEQVQGYEDMFEQNGSNNNYAYYLLNRVDALGNPLPPGPIGEMPEQKVPQAISSLIGLSSEAVQMVMPDGQNVNYADIELSGDAIAQLNAKINQQSTVFLENRKHALRRDAEIFASFATKILDIPTEIIVTSKDGKRKKEKVLMPRYDAETGEFSVANDLRLARFEVVTKIGPSYQTERERMRKEFAQQIAVLPPDDPMRDMFMLKYAELMDGIDTQDIRDYAHKQLLIKGYKEPESEEDLAILQAEQNKQKAPDPNMLFAQAEMTKAQAAMMREQTNAAKAQNDIATGKVGAQAKVYSAQTGRMNASTQRLRAVLDHTAKLKQIDASKQQGGGIHVVREHPVIGNATENDIADTMAAHGISRDHVIRKLEHARQLHGHAMARRGIIPHPVHGFIKEKDVQETMQKHGMSREQVLRKVMQHKVLHDELQNQARQIAMRA